MPTFSIRTGRALLVTTSVFLAGCGAEEKFREVGPQMEGPSTTIAPATTASTLPALVPYVGDGFTISLPGASQVQIVSTPSAAGPVDTTFVTSKPSAGTEYGITYNSAAYKGLPAKGVDLDAVARRAAADAKGTLADLRTVVYKGYAGRDFRVDGAAGQATIFVRVVLVKQRTLTVTAVLDLKQTAAPDLYRQVLESLTFT